MSDKKKMQDSHIFFHAFLLQNKKLKMQCIFACTSPILNLPIEDNLRKTVSASVEISQDFNVCVCIFFASLKNNDASVRIYCDRLYFSNSLDEDGYMMKMKYFELI